MIKDTTVKWLTLPLRDFFSAVEAGMSGGRLLCIPAVMISALVSWWVYVPVHELMHVLGCLISGGKVSRLEISGIYGASMLKKIFPFVSVGSAYSGRLSGFDTGGSDFIFFITDFLPYVLTIFLGVPLLRSVPTLKASSMIKSILFGLAAPVAYAPFMSVFGDYYEMGSILVTRLASSGTSTLSPDRWRSDDLFRLVDRLFTSRAGPHAFDAVVVLFSLLAGVLLVFATYWAGTLFSSMLCGRKK